MRRLVDIATEEESTRVLTDLTGVFEGIASMKIAQVKNKVQSSQSFFQDLWSVYSQMRVDSIFRFGRKDLEGSEIDKDLFVVVTAEGGFSGDIDQKLIKWMLKHYKKDQHDILVIGHHGAIQLAQAGVQYVKYYKLPQKDEKINVQPIVKYVQKYRNTTVYYQTYVSLMVQDIKRLELSKAVAQLGSKAEQESEKIISDKTYIFEPSTYEVVSHMERTMINITLSQVIFESKLAQYASRFRAMSDANEKAQESLHDVHLLYNRTKRALKDERLKEIVYALRQKRLVS